MYKHQKSVQKILQSLSSKYVQRVFIEIAVYLHVCIGGSLIQNVMHSFKMQHRPTHVLLYRVRVKIVAAFFVFCVSNIAAHCMHAQ